MKELRILFATICLLYVAAFVSVASVSASEHEDGGQKKEVHSSDKHDDDDDDYKKKAKKAYEKKKAERIKALREKMEKARKRAKQSYTGSTLSGGVTVPKTPVVPKTPTTPAQPTVPATPTTPVASAAVTKTSTVNYNTPDGSVPVTFSATVKDGIITAASSTKKAGGTSGYYQDIFIKGVSAAFVGKKVAGLNVAAVGGASLTTTAFEKFVQASF